MANSAILDTLKKALSQGLLEQKKPVVSGPGAKRDRMYSIDKLSSKQSSALKKAKKFATDQSVKQVLVRQTIIQQQQQMMNFQLSMQKQQALALMCRIYVGSINFEVREDTVKTAFLPFGPIKSLSLAYDPILQKHKGFSFIEYELPEAAQMALDQMNNALLAGRNCKVGRPSNMPQAQPIIEQLSREALKYNRIYIASVHSDLTNNDIQSVFESFGKVISCSMVPDASRPGKHRGFGFIEYDNPQSCVDAINSMNLFDLGGQFIRVGRAVTPPGMILPATVPTGLPTASAVAAAQVSAKLTAMDALYQMQGITPPSVAIPSLSSAPSSLSNNQLANSQLASAVSNQLASAVNSLAAAQMMSNVFSSLTAGQLTTPILMPTVQWPGAQPQPGQVVMNSKQALSSGAATAVQNNANGNVDLTESQKRLMEDDNAMSLEQQENMKISGAEARHLVMHKLMRRTESRVLVLRNMVGAEDIDDTLETEVTDECARYGNVEKVIIYQERQGETEDAEIIVKIFVEFSKPSEVEAAIKSLNGRFFGGRTVSAQTYEQSLYNASDLSQ